jgi:hypothetical protein
MTRIAVYGPAGVTAAGEVDSRPLRAFFGRCGTNARDPSAARTLRFIRSAHAPVTFAHHLKETQ